MAARPTVSQAFLSTRYHRTGTRFRIYLHPSKFGLGRPETIYLDAAPGTIGPGPADADIYVVDAKNKPPYFDVRTFTDTESRPPWGGPRRQAAQPRAGHFDHIGPRHPAFSATTAFAIIRCALMVWEHYLGRKVRWYFRDTYRRLEVIPRCEVQNAISRFGYIELGFRNLAAHAGPYAENFDVVSHEMGHAILRDVVGYSPVTMPPEYRAHEEAAADLVAIVAVLHFRSVVRLVLRQTKGNLFTANALTRLAEFGRFGPIRRAFNWDTMGTVQFDLNPEVFKYALALPFLGGAFAVLVEMFQQRLVEAGAILPKLAAKSDQSQGAQNKDFTPEFAKAFRAKPAAFEPALLDARDAFGALLAATWSRLDMRTLSFRLVAETMLEADHALFHGRHERIIRKCFTWRDILPPRRGWRRP